MLAEVSLISEVHLEAGLVLMLDRRPPTETESTLAPFLLDSVQVTEEVVSLDLELVTSE